MEWSNKAIALGKGAVKGQLTKELANYKERKPWREEIASDALLDLDGDSENDGDEGQAASGSEANR